FFRPRHHTQAQQVAAKARPPAKTGRPPRVAGPTARAILDHIFVPQQASSAAADVPQRDSADAQ
ncbi:hypothetical protein B9043_004530, partial [Klebsiella pneumoniae]|uniref:hypothetical protein n=1 Tax=Klebsiella pneumoniae TaxID=573 RepID=UPI000B7137DE